MDLEKDFGDCEPAEAVDLELLLGVHLRVGGLVIVDFGAGVEFVVDSFSGGFLGFQLRFTEDGLTDVAALSVSLEAVSAEEGAEVSRFASADVPLVDVFLSAVNDCC